MPFSQFFEKIANFYWYFLSVLNILMDQNHHAAKRQRPALHHHQQFSCRQHGEIS